MLTKRQVLVKKEQLLNYLGNNGANSRNEGIKEIDSLCENLEINYNDFSSLCELLAGDSLIKTMHMAGTWSAANKITTIWLTPKGFEQAREKKPKWQENQAPQESQRKAVKIVEFIKEWIPKQRFKHEESYEAALAEYLEAKGIKAPEQQGTSLTDILAAYEIAIEVKLHPSRSEYDRLMGQIIRQLEEFSIVIVVIVRPDKRDLLEEYESKFDERVIFITKQDT